MVAKDISYARRLASAFLTAIKALGTALDDNYSKWCWVIQHVVDNCLRYKENFLQSAYPFEQVVPSPFRKSIWKKTGDYHFGKCSVQELDDLAQVYDVIAAKLRIPFPTPAVCRELIVVIAALPDDPAAAAPVELISMLKQYLRATKRMRGVGIPVAICMLAVMKEGLYAPMDKKDADGLQNLGVVTAEEAKHLTGSAIGSFVQIYATKVLPAWHAETRKRVPEQVDAYWGSHAKIASHIEQE